MFAPAKPQSKPMKDDGKDCDHDDQKKYHPPVDCNGHCK
jgi:hypothetical protein